jgi:hypothetical protein
MTKMSKEAVDRLMDMFFGPVDPTAMTLYQAETLTGLLARDAVETAMIYKGQPEREGIPLSEGICRLFMQQQGLIKRGLVVVDAENMLHLTPDGEAMAASLVSHYRKACQRLPEMEAAADQMKQARQK